ncbi:MAG: hypothetical protein V1847_03815 [Candidatus Diapherotrites archaeon]
MKRWLGIPAALAGILSFSSIAHAHCPLCTAAVGGAVIGAEYLGLGAGIVGLFVGAFAISTGIWIGRKIKTRYIPFQLPLIVLASFLLTVIPLLGVSPQTLYIPVLWFGQAGTAFNKVYFTPKLLLGSAIGALLTLFALKLHTFLKKWKGRVLFPFQGIAFTLAILLMASGVLYIAWAGG